LSVALASRFDADSHRALAFTSRISLAHRAGSNTSCAKHYGSIISDRRSCNRLQAVKV